jgi:hypothetical protein
MGRSGYLCLVKPSNSARLRHHQQKTLSFGTRILDVKADGYGPSIKLGIWSLSANGHFGA